jgi:hypothetical protein
MERGPIARAEHHQRRGRCQQAVSMMKSLRRSIAVVCPSIGLSGAKRERRPGGRNHCAIGKLSQGSGNRMDALTRAFEPLVMQDGVHRFGGRARAALRSRPGIAKPLDGLAPAVKAGTMTCRKRDGLIEKKQLRPASSGHDRPAAAFVLAATNEPGLRRPAPLQQGLCRGIMDDATIAGEHAPLGDSDNLAEGCDAVLKRHRRSAGLEVEARCGHASREASRSSRARLRSTPRAYPESDPSCRTTRWHGMATARLFAAQAPATPRAALRDRDREHRSSSAGRILPWNLLAARSTTSPAGTSLPEHRTADRVWYRGGSGRRLGSDHANGA